MSFLEIAKKRYSVRKYTEDQVYPEILQKILEAGRVAPTATNSQPQKMIVIQSPEGLNKISKAANFFGAPTVILVCGDTEEACIRGYDRKCTVETDIGIVTTHMMMEAEDCGVGSLWICNFKPDIIRKEFNLPKNIIPYNILALGFPAEEGKSPDRHATARKPIAETVFYEKMF